MDAERDTAPAGVEQPTKEDYIDTKEAALLLGVDEQTLRRRRVAGYKGPAGPQWYERLGRIVYKRSEVQAFIARRPAPRERRPRPLPKVPLPR